MGWNSLYKYTQLLQKVVDFSYAAPSLAFLPRWPPTPAFLNVLHFTAFNIIIVSNPSTPLRARTPGRPKRILPRSFTPLIINC